MAVNKISEEATGPKLVAASPAQQAKIIADKIVLKEIRQIERNMLLGDAKKKLNEIKALNEECLVLARQSGTTSQVEQLSLLEQEQVGNGADSEEESD